MSYRILQQAAETRRSIYALNKQLPLSAAETVQIVEHAVKHTPSSFNSQSTRVVVLFGTEHEKLVTRCKPGCALRVPGPGRGSGAARVRAQKNARLARFWRAWRAWREALIHRFLLN